MGLTVSIPEIMPEEDIENAFVDFLMKFATTDDRGRPIRPYFQLLEALFEKDVYSLTISYPDLVLGSPRIARLFLEKPKYVLKIFNRALRRAIREIYRDVPEYVLRRFRVRIKDLGFEIKIRDVFRSENIERAVGFRALVVRVSQPKQFLRRAIYICEVCGRAFPFESDELYTRPRSCGYPDCRNTNPNKFILSKDGQEFEEYQELIVQELPEELPAGKLPESCQVVVYGDLVDKVRPGDRIKITGIVHVIPERKLTEGRKPLFRVYVEAIHIEKPETEEEEIQLTEEEIERIRSLKNDPKLEEKVYASIAPSICGLEVIKKAIAAQLFGGVHKLYPDGTRVRGDIHILLIGDPGTAKSQLLKYVASLAPRAIYTSGKGSTAAGLTAAVVRTEDGWALEAGVLVLCDKGIACIDEFDKMREEDRRAIHEALEQQTVSIAKAGIVATLNARTSVLAAANPKFGRYYTRRGLKDNIDLPPTILSRFDLIFVLKDIPNEERDAKIVDHVLQMHGKIRSPTPPIPPDLFKKYVLYAREHINPRLTERALKKLKEFYLQMRRSAVKYQEDHLEMHPVPITLRHLEALVRLTEAHARMLLKEEADESDAEFAIQLMNESLRQVAYDVEAEVMDVGAIYTGQTFTQRSRYRYVLQLIRRLQEEYENGVPIREIIRRCEEVGISREFVYEVIRKEKMASTIYEPEAGKIKIIEE